MGHTLEEVTKNLRDEVEAHLDLYKDASVWSSYLASTDTIFGECSDELHEDDFSNFREAAAVINAEFSDYEIRLNEFARSRYHVEIARIYDAAGNDLRVSH